MSCPRATSPCPLRRRPHQQVQRHRTIYRYRCYDSRWLGAALTLRAHRDHGRTLDDRIRDNVARVWMPLQRHGRHHIWTPVAFPCDSSGDSCRAVRCRTPAPLASTCAVHSAARANATEGSHALERVDLPAVGFPHPSIMQDGSRIGFDVLYPCRLFEIVRVPGYAAGVNTAHSLVLVLGERDES